MKKITLISACMLLFTSVSAEQMQFVTTMSAPVGNFARLDAADPTHVTRVGKDGDSSSGYLNFCNTRSGVGDIIIKGAGAYLKQIDIQNGTTLGSTNTPEYRLSEKLTVENGGTVNAGRIMASNVTFKDTNFHQSNVTNTIYGNDIPVMGGKTDNMDISGTAKINKSAQNSAYLNKEMEWSNEYQCDYNSSANTEGESVWGTEYVDVKEYIGNNSAYTSGKGAPWYEPGDDSRKYDVQCECVSCFDEGSNANFKENLAPFFTEICKEHGVNARQNGAPELAQWASTRLDPSYYEQENFNAGSRFYTVDYILDGHYGSNANTWLVNNSSCIGTTHDIGPDPVSVRAKSYAIGCLVKVDETTNHIDKYGVHYCAFWNCRVKEPGEGTSQECTTPKYTSYLLKSKARVAEPGDDSGSGKTYKRSGSASQQNVLQRRVTTANCNTGNGPYSVMPNTDPRNAGASDFPYAYDSGAAIGASCSDSVIKSYSWSVGACEGNQAHFDVSYTVLYCE
ncbi:hypothetical protein [Candidatus Avelusimicrobium fimicolum]|uniref:hypothetical protein n=2 Tax=Candidatus Avelusimicrobium fimicolum TaxID=3416216 RepID=UPI003D147C3A